MDYKKMTVAEIDAKIAELKLARTLALKTEKNEADALIRETLESLVKGDMVTFMFKGEEVTAPFEKLTEKRFTVLIDGERKSIMFDKYMA